MTKTRVIILFGGRSAEHEISVLSARNVYLALDPERFEPLLISIDKQGRWHVEPRETLLEATGDPRHLRLRGAGQEVPVPVRPITDSPTAMVQSTKTSVPAIMQRDDVVFPVLHGTYGEDGTLQGLLELADVAYVGSGYLGSGIGMDKDVAKRLLAQAGIPVVPAKVVRSIDYQKDPDAVRAAVVDVGFPLFVKPANAGSSVGVTKVTSADAIHQALETAFAYDTKVLVESGIDAREIECAVLGNDDPRASIPGEIVVTHQDGFYSYDAKYVDVEGSHCEIPANISVEIADRVRQLSIATFKALELAGMARVDFFLERGTDKLYVNEVNTIPGFTAISMYPKMWEATGISQKELVTKLVELAIERRAARRALKTTY